MLHKIIKKMAKVMADKSNENRDLETSGLVFNIQKYSIHDGPSIRTSVFLKGCPLSCNWCSNPESIKSFPEIITRYSTLCTDCDTCLNICSNDAVEVKKPVNTADKQNKPVRSVNRKKCLVCKQCVENCPTGALRIMGSYQTEKEILDTVEQDRPFYENSSGGMTLSGGEPLFQPEFTLALLRESKRRKIHTVLDTSGYASVELWKQIIPYVTLFCMISSISTPGNIYLARR